MASSSSSSSPAAASMQPLIDDLNTLENMPRKGRSAISASLVDSIRTFALKTSPSSTFARAVADQIAERLLLCAEQYKLAYLYLVDALCRRGSSSAPYIAAFETLLSGEKCAAEIMRAASVSEYDKEKIRKLVDIWAENSTFSGPFTAIARQTWLPEASKARKSRSATTPASSATASNDVLDDGKKTTNIAKPADTVQTDNGSTTSSYETIDDYSQLPALLLRQQQQQEIEKKLVLESQATAAPAAVPSLMPSALPQFVNNELPKFNFGQLPSFLPSASPLPNLLNLIPKVPLPNGASAAPANSSSYQADSNGSSNSRSWATSHPYSRAKEENGHRRFLDSSRDTVPSSYNGSHSSTETNFQRKHTPSNPISSSPWIQIGAGCGQDEIKVLSRTLEVSGFDHHMEAEDFITFFGSQFGHIAIYSIHDSHRSALIRFTTRKLANEAKNSLLNPIQASWVWLFAAKANFQRETGTILARLDDLTSDERSLLLNSREGGFHQPGGIRGGHTIEEPSA